MLLPRNVLDCIAHGRDTFSELPRVVNLYTRPRMRIPWGLFARVLAGGMVAIYLLFGSVSAPDSTSSLYAQTTPPTQAEREALEEQLMALEAEIATHESTIVGLKREGSSLQSEIKNLNAKISKLNLQIKAINLSLTKLNQEIGIKEGEIKVTEGKIALNRDALTRALQQVYEVGQTNLIEVLLENPTLSSFVGGMNNLLEVQQSLALTIEQITGLRDELVQTKEVLALKRDDAVALKVYQDKQRASIEDTKKEKNTLLTVTKGKESQYQEIVKERRKTAAQIRSRIFELLGGGELTFEEAYKFAKFAEDAVGVRAALILAVLDRESALGQNVGRCSYKTAMHPKRDIPIFLEIVASLGLNPDMLSVSCANSDGAYGGAMGPAQFIPSTWKLYKDRIAEITGVQPSSPWNNGAAFVGTALYLKDAGAKRGATLSEERIAAARYYAGSRWRTHLWGYGDRVVTRAREFQQDVDLLNS